MIASVQLIKGQAAEAARTATLVAADDPNRPAADVVGVAAVNGQAADRALAAFLAKYSATNPYEVAQIHGWRDEHDLAFAAIARA